MPERPPLSVAALEMLAREETRARHARYLDEPREDRYATCSVDGCAKPARARGWCSTHDQRVRRTGTTDLAPRKIKPEAERFWAKVNKTETCWLWTAASSEGYGRFTVAGGANVYAHRYAYELLVAAIPAGLVIDHLCRVTLCVNPDHLEPVPQRLNMLRGESEAAKAVRFNRCIRGHEFTPENTYVTSRGFRHCRVCISLRRKSVA